MAGLRDDIRIGDAERNEMSELLTQHYSDGRLDEAEFRERVDQAMKAKTAGDLRGLLSDLPPLGVAGRTADLPTPPRRRRVVRTVGLVVIALVLASMVRAFFFWPIGAPHIGLVLLIVFGFILLRRRGPWHRHHHPHHDTGDAPPGTYRV